MTETFSTLPLAEQTPVQIDTKLASLMRQFDSLFVNEINLQTSIKRYEGKKDGERLFAVSLERLRKDLAKNLREAAALRDAMKPLHDEFDRRGGWTRAFLVVTKGQGHVHSSRSCSTCFRTTRFCWLPRYSGQEESLIVEDAGERACTVCYPSAPVDVRNRPTKIWSEEELAAKAKRDAQKEAARIKKDTKGITAPDGSDLRLPPRNGGKYGQRVETLWSALDESKRALGNLLDARLSPPDWWTPEQVAEEIAEQEAILAAMLPAIAHKQGRTEKEIRDELDAKAQDKRKKERRSAGLLS